MNMPSSIHSSNPHFFHTVIEGYQKCVLHQLSNRSQVFMHNKRINNLLSYYVRKYMVGYLPIPAARFSLKAAYFGNGGFVII